MIEIFYYDGGLKEAKISDLHKIKGKKMWVDITGMTIEDRDMLMSKFQLHQLTVEDLFKSRVRIKIEEFPEYMFFVGYGIKKDDIVELDFVLGKNFLITNHKPKLDSFTTLKENKSKLEGLFKNGLDFIFHWLLDYEIDNFFPFIDDIDGDIEEVDEIVIKKPKQATLKKIQLIKKRVNELKKVSFPQREKIANLAKKDYSFISRKAVPYFRDIYDNSVRLADSIESCRDAIGNTFEAYMSSVSNSTNETMKVLSIISTIGLPLTAISGIYGTNFKNLPGSDHPIGFWIMLTAMILFITVMIVYFKKREWI